MKREERVRTNRQKPLLRTQRRATLVLTALAVLLGMLASRRRTQAAEVSVRQRAQPRPQADTALHDTAQAGALHDAVDQERAFAQAFERMRDRDS